MEGIKRMTQNFLRRLFPSPPPPLSPPPSALEQHHRQPQTDVAAPHNAHRDLDWPVLVVGFCFASAVAIALQTLQTRATLPITNHLLCLAMACAVASLFVAKYIASKLPDTARVLEHVGVLCGVTAFFFAITVSSPLCLKLTFWTIYALSLLVIVVCNRCCGRGI